MDRSIARDLAAMTRQSVSCSRACLEAALQFPDENWNWRSLTYLFPDPEIVRAHVDKPWEWAALSFERYASLFLEFPDKGWDWKSMTTAIYNSETFVDVEFVSRYIHKPWPWKQLSSYHPKHDDFNFFKLMERFPDKPNLRWNWRGLSSHRLLNAEILAKYADMPWDFKVMSFNPKLTLAMVRVVPTPPANLAYNYAAGWEWRGVSLSPSISLEEILANPDLPWNWRGVSANPNVTYEQAMILKEKIEWDWAEFVQKPGGVESFVQYRKRDAAARRIQKRWRKCVSDPTYLVCQRRLEREFRSM
jgi:hypothetical protein